MIRQLCPILDPNLNRILSLRLNLNLSQELAWEVTSLVKSWLNPQAMRQSRGQYRGMPWAGGMGRLVGPGS